MLFDFERSKYCQNCTCIPATKIKLLYLSHFERHLHQTFRTNFICFHNFVFPLLESPSAWLEAICETPVAHYEVILSFNGQKQNTGMGLLPLGGGGGGGVVLHLSDSAVAPVYFGTFGWLVYQLVRNLILQKSLQNKIAPRAGPDTFPGQFPKTLP